MKILRNIFLEGDMLVLELFFIAFYFPCNIQATVSAEFPLQEFIQTAFKVPKNFTGSNFLENAKLSFLCGSGCCDCDEDCFRKRSCCIDKLWNASNPIPLSEYMTNFKKEVDKTLPLECHFLEPFASLAIFKQMTIASPDSRLEYLLVASCPKGSIHVSKCLSDQNLPDVERLPVIDEQFYIFKNKYCAMCNNVKTFVNLNLTVKCKYSMFTGQPTVNVTAPPHPPMTELHIPPNAEVADPTVPPNV